MANRTQKIVVTSALPYANGPIHLGHLIEYIQTDVFVRFLRLIGEPVIYCCADDAHGTPIDISAMKKGILPEQLIGEIYNEHVRDFKDFLISFDSYYSTNSEENRKYSNLIFAKLKEKGLIYKKEVELTYCPKCRRFLPDRYVKGKCPKCGEKDQYGDVCEKCNSAYSTIELVNPYCAICGSAPARKTSGHYFFKLSACSKDLRKWLESNRNLQPEVKNYVLNWIKEGLKDWDITRDGPYFGFSMPGEENLYYYVWLDAPIGYIASTENYCKKGLRDLKSSQQKDADKCVDEYWKKGRIIHFIGKDIIYFHFLFWPAMLMNSGFSLPEDIIVHGFLTVNREKMSKSRGTFLTARDYLKVLDPEYLRFYYASNLSKTMSDIDLDFNDFKSSINNKLVADIANFAYRVLFFAEKNLGSKTASFSEPKLEKELKGKYEGIKEAYLNHDERKAVRLILEVGSIGNKYFQDNRPWELMKSKAGTAAKDRKKMEEVVSFCVSLIKDISIIIKPVLPRFSSNIEKQLSIKEQSWKDLGIKLKNHRIGKSAILIKKIENELDRFAVRDELSMVDLRVAKVLEAKKHPQADKLIMLQIDTGTDRRQILAGLAAYYQPEELVGKNIVIIKNLKPAKLRGEVSAGMLLAGGDGDVHKVIQAQKSKPGDKVFINGIEPMPENEMKEITIEDFAKIKLVVENKRVKYKGESLRTSNEEIFVELDKGSVS
ncbi:MAG: methionine--tRNA ligase [Candidatus Woesearchaeota archaeon]|nr:methionine--tRNA ligase [Candidatus Woesearchaeota archaeon]